MADGSKGQGRLRERAAGGHAPGTRRRAISQAQSAGAPAARRREAAAAAAAGDARRSVGGHSVRLPPLVLPAPPRAATMPVTMRLTAASPAAAPAAARPRRRVACAAAEPATTEAPAAEAEEPAPAPPAPAATSTALVPITKGGVPVVRGEFDGAFSPTSMRKYWCTTPASTVPTDALYGPGREIYPDRWFPNGRAEHLDGTLAGDYGVDPFRLGLDKDALAKYREREVQNGRWAMLAVVGTCVPELYADNFSNADSALWWKAGADILGDGKIDYLGNPGLVHATSLPAIAVFQFFAMAGMESYRKNGGPLGKADPNDPVSRLYPGGKFFDPLGLADDAEVFAELQVNEIKHCRLAMLAFMGEVFQAGITGEGPVANLRAHMMDPKLNNIIDNTGAAYGVRGWW